MSKNIQGTSSSTRGQAVDWARRAPALIFRMSQIAPLSSWRELFA